jgi:hypothetical protein
MLKYPGRLDKKQMPLLKQPQPFPRNLLLHRFEIGWRGNTVFSIPSSRIYGSINPESSTESKPHLPRLFYEPPLHGLEG